MDRWTWTMLVQYTCTVAHVLHTCRCIDRVHADSIPSPSSLSFPFQNTISSNSQLLRWIKKKWPKPCKKQNPLATNRRHWRELERATPPRGSLPQPPPPPPHFCRSRGVEPSARKAAIDLTKIGRPRRLVWEVRHYGWRWWWGDCTRLHRRILLLWRRWRRMWNIKRVCRS